MPVHVQAQGGHLSRGRFMFPGEGDAGDTESPSSLCSLSSCFGSKEAHLGAACPWSLPQQCDRTAALAITLSTSLKSLLFLVRTAKIWLEVADTGSLMTVPGLCLQSRICSSTEIVFLKPKNLPVFCTATRDYVVN